MALTVALPGTSLASPRAEAMPVDSAVAETSALPEATPVRVAAPSAAPSTSASTPLWVALAPSVAMRVTEEEALSNCSDLAVASPVAVCFTVMRRSLSAVASAFAVADSVACASMLPCRTVAVSLALAWALLVLMAFTVTFFSTDILTWACGTVTCTVAQAWPLTAKAFGQ